MKKGLYLFFAAAVVMLAGAGCASTVSVPEILQMSVGDKTYTKCNIWYTNPEKINCLNPQSGRILPAGSEVELLESTTDNVRFRDVKTKIVFNIEFDGDLRMSSIQQYVQQILTTLPPQELFKDIPPETLDRIIHGEIVPGMTRAHVLLCYGTPAATRTPSMTNSTWIYWADQSNTLRVNFRGDKVRSTTNLAD